MDKGRPTANHDCGRYDAMKIKVEGRDEGTVLNITTHDTTRVNAGIQSFSLATESSNMLSNESSFFGGQSGSLAMKQTSAEIVDYAANRERERRVGFSAPSEERQLILSAETAEGTASIRRAERRAPEVPGEENSVTKRMRGRPRASEEHKLVQKAMKAERDRRRYHAKKEARKAVVDEGRLNTKIKEESRDESTALNITTHDTTRVNAGIQSFSLATESSNMLSNESSFFGGQSGSLAMKQTLTEIVDYAASKEKERSVGLLAPSEERQLILSSKTAEGTASICRAERGAPEASREENSVTKRKRGRPRASEEHKLVQKAVKAERDRRRYYANKEARKAVVDEGRLVVVKNKGGRPKRTEEKTLAFKEKKAKREKLRYMAMKEALAAFREKYCTGKTIVGSMKQSDKGTSYDSEPENSGSTEVKMESNSGSIAHNITTYDTSLVNAGSQVFSGTAAENFSKTESFGKGVINQTLGGAGSLLANEEGKGKEQWPALSEEETATVKRLQLRYLAKLEAQKGLRNWAKITGRKRGRPKLTEEQILARKERKRLMERQRRLKKKEARLALAAKRASNAELGRCEPSEVKNVDGNGSSDVLSVAKADNSCLKTGNVFSLEMSVKADQETCARNQTLAEGNRTGVKRGKRGKGRPRATEQQKLASRARKLERNRLRYKHIRELKKAGIKFIPRKSGRPKVHKEPEIVHEPKKATRERLRRKAKEEARAAFREKHDA